MASYKTSYFLVKIPLNINSFELNCFSENGLIEKIFLPLIIPIFPHFGLLVSKSMLLFLLSDSHNRYSMNFVQ